MTRSKFRSGPSAVFCSQQSAGLVQPGAQICGSPGLGNGRKSGGATGIGFDEAGLVFTLTPVKPVSSPSILLPVAKELFGSVSGPKVLWLTLPCGTIGSPYRVIVASE